jgi:hypothetical protein
MVRDYPGVAAETSHRAAMAPLGGVVRPRRKVRFARFLIRRARDLGVPSARAAFGGS